MDFSFKSDRRNFLQFLSGAAVVPAVISETRANKSESVSGVIVQSSQSIDTNHDALSTLVRNYPNVGPYDIQPWVLWDTIYPNSVPTNGNDFWLFNSGIDSSTPPGKTNVYMPRSLPLPEQFAMQRIVVLGNSADLRTVQNWVLKLWIGCKVYVDRPISTLKCSDNPIGVYLDVHDSIGRRNAVSSDHGSLFRSSDQTLVVESGRHFYVEIIPDVKIGIPRFSNLVLPSTYHATGNSVLTGEVKVMLDGWLARGVQ